MLASVSPPSPSRGGLRTQWDMARLLGSSSGTDGKVPEHASFDSCLVRHASPPDNSFSELCFWGVMSMQ